MVRGSSSHTPRAMALRQVFDQRRIGGRQASPDGDNAVGIVSVTEVDVTLSGCCAASPHGGGVELLDPARRWLVRPWPRTAHRTVVAAPARAVSISPSASSSMMSWVRQVMVETTLAEISPRANTAATLRVVRVKPGRRASARRAALRPRLHGAALTAAVAGFPAVDRPVGGDVVFVVAVAGHNLGDDGQAPERPRLPSERVRCSRRHRSARCR